MLTVVGTEEVHHSTHQAQCQAATTTAKAAATQAQRTKEVDSLQNT